ncbi:hemerythrin domain-containing protein [Naasia sp.]|uniref:hemerythrin domain-containing protein n=1 Tax=Naasia sp. TaxID=2546198 RepID=UPI002615C1D9|nr:hemerythrin domain-containing protein [Naasia sp.]
MPRQSLDVPGCETGDMVMIHGLFRSMFGDAPGLVRSVAPGDRDRAKIVGDHVLEMVEALHRHHHGEDTLLWDRLSERSPACGLHIAVMKSQHQAMSALLDEVVPTTKSWQARGSVRERTGVAEKLDGVNAALLEHLGAEERDILPSAAAALSQREWNLLGEHGRAGIPKGRLFIQLGFILQSMPAASRHAFLAEMPPPARVLYRLVGRHQYAAHRRRVYGTAA